ncbi:MAG: hypothetical protein U0Q16_04060 [Bryobacteraceae bacterium]
MTVSADWIAYARRFGFAAVWLIALSILAPALGLGLLVLIVASALLSRSFVLGIGLAATAAPFGLWLLEHPGAVALAACAAISWALVWFHRQEIRRSL